MLNEPYKKWILPNREQIAYRERAGGEQTVILVHGNMTSSKHWDVLMDAMDAKYKVYAPDFRGFGESSYNERVTSIKDFSDDLKGFVDALELKDFYLVGWSTGGAVCMQFVADYPGYCEKLVFSLPLQHVDIHFSGQKKMAPQISSIAWSQLRKLNKIRENIGRCKGCMIRKTEKD